MEPKTVQEGPIVATARGVAQLISEDRQEREYVEIIASLRHYSNLRFAVLSVFYAVTAGLLIGAMGFPVVEGMKFSETLIMMLKMLGVVVTIVLFSYDFMIDGYQIAFRKHLNKVWPESHWFTRPKYSYVFQWPLRALYLMMLLFWIVCVATDGAMDRIIGKLM